MYCMKTKYFKYNKITIFLEKSDYFCINNKMVTFIRRKNRGAGPINALIVYPNTPVKPRRRILVNNHRIERLVKRLF